MNKVWGRETLRFVDAWACKDGTLEDDEGRKRKARTNLVVFSEKSPSKSSVSFGLELNGHQVTLGILPLRILGALGPWLKPLGDAMHGSHKMRGSFLPTNWNSCSRT